MSFKEKLLCLAAVPVAILTVGLYTALMVMGVPMIVWILALGASILIATPITKKISNALNESEESEEMDEIFELEEGTYQSQKEEEKKVMKDSNQKMDFTNESSLQTDPENDFDFIATSVWANSLDSIKPVDKSIENSESIVCDIPEESEITSENVSLESNMDVELDDDWIQIMARASFADRYKESKEAEINQKQKRI